MQEALDNLKDENINVDAMRIRSFPFNLEVWEFIEEHDLLFIVCLLYTSPSPRDRTRSRMPSSA